MPDFPDSDQPPKDHAEQPSSYLASELGALWAFLRARHPVPAEALPHLPPKSRGMKEAPTRPALEAELAERVWGDEAFRAALLADSTAVIRRELQAYGIVVPDGLTIDVHEETPTQIHLTLPYRPPEKGDAELDDESLDLIAGGHSGHMPYIGPAEGRPAECIAK